MNTQAIIDAAVESFDLGPEDQDAVLRFGMKLQDMEDAERKAQPSVEVAEIIKCGDAMDARLGGMNTGDGLRSVWKELTKHYRPNLTDHE